MKKLFALSIPALLFCATLLAQNNGEKGNLFIIGGGNRSDALIQKMVATAGLRPSDYIVVLPMASEQPDTGFYYISRQLAQHTTALIRNFDFNRQSTNNAAWVDSVAGARLIYILGGDQNRFMQAVLHTPVYAAIHKAYQQGATIAGTSAGAAVMSRYMITGQQQKDSVYRETFDKLWSDNIEFAEGLGLLKHTIIDQHFIRRSRYNRLLSALAEKPGYLGVGIDEGTAVLIHGNKATVVGESGVVRFQPPQKTGTTPQGLIKIRNMKLDVFTDGDVFRIQP